MVAAPPFFASVQPVTTAELGASWHPGCPVGATDLRTMRISYWGFDGVRHIGSIVVNRSVTGDVRVIFRALYRARFPIRHMEPVAGYGGSDNRSMAADNTSGFNCRYAVAPGPKRWSVHAYGEAIDVNTVENPYLEGGQVLPAAGAAYRNRTDVRPGWRSPAASWCERSPLAGWQWGGRWTASPDWQHFSKTGG